MNGNGRFSRLDSGAKWILTGFSLVFAALGCSIAAGAGIGAAMIGTAAVVRGCYDSVDVEVVDSVTGARACQSEVIAREAGGSTTRFASCFHADLPAGRWTVTARRPGYQSASSEVLVTKDGGCQPIVQSIALSLRPEGAPPPSTLAVRPLRPGEGPLNKGSLAAPASLGADADLQGEGTPPATTPTASTSTPPLPGSAAQATGTAGAASAPHAAAFPIGGGGASGGVAGAVGPGGATASEGGSTGQR